MCPDRSLGLSQTGALGEWLRDRSARGLAPEQVGGRSTAKKISGASGHGSPTLGNPPDGAQLSRGNPRRLTALRATATLVTKEVEAGLIR